MMGLERFNCEDQQYHVPAGTIDISPLVLDERGRMKIMPTYFWARTTPAERRLFGWNNGVYLLPTTELVQDLKARIAGRTAIEIGSGNGVLAEALGITATDSRIQERPSYRAKVLREGGQPVRYGDNVLELDALRAVRKFKPEVVIACWVTHKYSRTRHSAGGNATGVIEEEVIAGCAEYIFVGNEYVHRNKSIWDLPHEIEYPSYVYSVAQNRSREFIATWRRP